MKVLVMIRKTNPQIIKNGHLGGLTAASSAAASGCQDM